MRPRILVAGIGDTGLELVKKLDANWEVIGLDSRPDVVEYAQRTFADLGLKPTILLGDATSALVLRKAVSSKVHAAVATAGSDEINLEFLRLAREELGIENRFALLYNPLHEETYRNQGIDLVSQDRACASILDTRVQGGRKVAAGIGLGQGEIIEVEVLAGSAVVGKSLAELHPRRWVVGAVYRKRKLIVPHGDTVLQAKDRVLIAGDPDILPSIATLIRAGESEFPLQYGSHLVTLCGPGTAAIHEEAVYLIRNTKADLFEAIACDADEAQMKSLLERCEADNIPYELSCTAQNSLESLVQEGKRRDVGILIMPPEPMSALARSGITRTRLSRVLPILKSPVLVSRKTFPYGKILLVLAELPFSISAAQLAIDAVRMFGAELHLCVVHQPDIVEGREQRETMDALRREVEVLAGMYHVRPHTIVLEGNPIREVLGLANEYDLMVLPYQRNRRAGLTRPNVGLHLIHRAKCSVMIMPN